MFDDASHIPDPRSAQPVAAVRGCRSVCAGPAANGCRRGQWRRVGRERIVRIRQALGFGCDGGARSRRQREHAETADVRFPRQPARRGRVSSRLSRADGAQRPRRRAQFDLECPGQAGRRCCRSSARGKILHGGRGRDRSFVPDHHDPRVGGGVGGADGRSNMTRATRDGDAYRITGHKWFMSAPMCDAFLVLAQADEGLTCFFMPRFTPDGSVNAIQFQRLKDKLGNGYVEEGILARHYRESPVNAIWEGSGNVMCLDVLRALSREADAASAVLQDLAEEAKGLPGAGDTVAFIGKAFHRPDSERVARLAVEKLALLAAAAALNKVSPHHAELFAATRLAGNHASMYGAVDLANDDIRGLLERALP